MYAFQSIPVSQGLKKTKMEAIPALVPFYFVQCNLSNSHNHNMIFRLLQIQLLTFGALFQQMSTFFLSLSIQKVDAKATASAINERPLHAAIDESIKYVFHKKWNFHLRKLCYT